MRVVKALSGQAISMDSGGGFEVRELRLGGCMTAPAVDRLTASTALDVSGPRLLSETHEAASGESSPLHCTIPDG